MKRVPDGRQGLMGSRGVVRNNGTTQQDARLYRYGKASVLQFTADNPANSATNPRCRNQTKG